MFKLVVLSSIVALAAASAIAPLGAWHGVPAWPAALAPVAHIPAPAVAVAPAIAAYNYRGPLSLAPGQPASILAHDGRPLDTLSVNVDRAVHYTAKAVDHAGGHWLKKRSAPVAWSHATRVDWAAPALAHARLAPLAPLAAPLTPLAAHAWRAPVAPLGIGHLGFAAGHHW